MKTAPVNKRGYQIDTGCPACGGELQLDEDFAVTHCDHCGSVIRLRLPASAPAWLIKRRIDRKRVRFFVDRYLKDRESPLSDPALEISGFYAPYWKIDAILLRLRHRIDKRFVFSEVGSAQDVREFEQETSSTTLTPYSVTVSAGGENSQLPASLGLRADVMKLKPFATEVVESDFGLLKVTLDEASAISRAVEIASNLDRMSAVGNRRNSSRLFAQRTGIVYQPFYIVKTRSGDDRLSLLVDATNGEVDEFTFDGELATAGEGGAEFAAVQVGLHQCGNCGTALPEVNSLLHVCPQCGRVTSLDPAINPAQMPLLFGPIAEVHNALFPFWALELSPDLAARIQRLVGGLNPASALVVPAFPLRNYETLFRLSLRMTTAIAQAPAQASQVWPVGSAPVTVSAHLARALAGAVLARSIVAQQEKIGSASEIDLAAIRPRLLFASFREEGYFFTDDHLNAVTFERTALG